jgi:gluconate kinase
MYPENDKPIQRVHLKDDAPDMGGEGVFLTFEMFKSQLVAIGQMREDEEIVQVNVHEDGIAFLFGKEK